MSDPRATVSMNQIGYLAVTQNFNSGITRTMVNGVEATQPAVTNVGQANSTVALGSAGNRVFGKAVTINDSDLIGGVQVRGEAVFTYTGTAPTNGASVECHGDGTVQVATSTDAGTNFVTWVDTTAHTVGVWLG